MLGSVMRAIDKFTIPVDQADARRAAGRQHSAAPFIGNALREGCA